MGKKKYEIRIEKSVIQGGRLILETMINGEPMNFNLPEEYADPDNKGKLKAYILKQYKTLQENIKKKEKPKAVKIEL